MDEYEVSVKVEPNISESAAIYANETPEKQSVCVHGSVEEETKQLVQVMTEVWVKVEREWEETEWGPSQAVRSELHADHEVKQEMVIGTESQPADAVFKTDTPSTEKTHENEAESDIPKCTQVELVISQDTVKQHKSNKERVSEKEKYICDICDETLSIKNRLISHIRSHMRNKPFFCATCDKIIHGRSENIHRRLHENTREYRCKYCNKQLVSLSALIKHEPRHTGDKPHVCNVCPKRFVCARSLDKHKRIHALVKQHACDNCEKKFKEKSQLKAHALLHAGEAAKQYVCQFCSKKFTHRYKLVVHERTHTGQTPHVCGICHKRYSQKFLLDAHTRLHTGEKPYTCSTCNKSFRLKNVLQTHLRTHSGIRPFACDVCGKSFTQKTHLRSHRSVHTGEKCLSCDTCKKMFACKSSLVKHIQCMHVAEKRIYSCDQCEKQFERACNLTVHKKWHFNKGVRELREAKKFVCDICSKEFGSKFNLNRHEIAKHGKAT